MTTNDPTVTDAVVDEHKPAIRPKSKATGKGKPKPAEAGKSKRSLNLSIPPDDHERLAVHALRRGVTISDLVCELARTHLREYHISRTGNRSAEDAA